MRSSALIRNFIKVFIITAVITGGLFFVYAPEFNVWSNTNKQTATIKKQKDTKVDANTFYKVSDVLDGDTFKVIINNDEVTVRMLGINTPETIDPRKPPECFGKEASDETKHLLTGHSVKLLLNPNREKYDKYGRALAYVYLADGLFVNEYLIQSGFAREYTVGKLYIYQKLFRADENKAKSENIGLWLKCK